MPVQNTPLLPSCQLQTGVAVASIPSVQISLPQSISTHSTLPSLSQALAGAHSNVIDPNIYFGSLEFQEIFLVVKDVLEK